MPKLIMTADWRHDLLCEFWGCKRIIRLAHKHGLYAKAASTRARMNEIASLFAKE